MPTPSQDLPPKYAFEFVDRHAAQLLAAANFLNLSGIARVLANGENRRSLVESVASCIRYFESALDSADEVLASEKHQRVLIRQLADKAFTLAGPEAGGAAVTSGDFQWEALRISGLLPKNAIAKADPQLEERVKCLAKLKSVPASFLKTLQALEAATGLPWERVEFSSMGGFGGETPFYRCRIENEGSCRLILGALNQISTVLPGDILLTTDATAVTTAAPALLIEIDAGCAESAQFRGQLAAIPAFDRARRELAQNAYPTHYTRFLHQPSVDDETCRKRLGLFEELVCDKGKTEPAAMRAASLEAILKTACRAPHGPEFGYTLFFEQEISRDLMHELVRRVAIQMTGTKSLEAWTTKLFTWDSKFELHLPPALVENVEFLSLLRANDEATQLARAIVLQDRSMMPSLDNAKEDRQERDKAAQEHQLKASAESKALNYSTGLSFAVGRFALQILPVSPLAGDRVASLMLELESVSPRALNSALRDSRLLDLVCNEDSRQVWFSSFFSAVADELKLHGIACKPGCTTGAFVAGISDHFIAAATQYMERLDHSGSYRWTLEDLE